MNVQFFSPLLDGHALTLILKVAIATRVIQLFFQCCPSTVRCPSFALALLAMAAGVVTVSVNSINTIFMASTRLFAHIGKEVFKAVSPSIANANSAPSPILITSTASIGATPDDVHPTLPFRCTGHAMLSAGFQSMFSSQAAATLRSTRAQAAACDYGEMPAFALAEPQSLFVSAANIAKHAKASKHLAGQVYYLLVCNRDDLWGIIHSVFGPPRPLTKPGAFIAPPGIFVCLHSFILAYFDRFGGVSSLTVKAAL